MNTIYLVGVAAAAIVLLLFLVMRLKMPAFVALLLVSILTAMASGIAPQDIMPLVIEGMGGTLGSVALLVGLGAMLGAVVEKSGGAEILAEKFTAKLGKERVGPALLLVSAVIAVPIFFDVAFIILIPIMFSFAKAAGHKSPVFVGVPIAALMVYIHNFVPPHPGVTGSSTLLGADVGLVTVVGLLISIPAGILAYYVSKKITTSREFTIDPQVQQKFDESGAADVPDGGSAGSGGAGSSGGAGGSRPGSSRVVGGVDGAGNSAGSDDSVAVAAPAFTRPGAAAVVSMILVPILMISVGTVGSMFLAEESTAAHVISLIGEPGLALLVALVLAMYFLGARHGWDRQNLSSIMDAALAPAAIVVFVTGAGGVFAKILTESGIGETISSSMVDLGVPILLLAFLLASVFKVAQGSGTVATLATAGLIQSAVTQGDYSAIQVVLIVLAIACGSVALSHINDSGFWIATKFLGLSVADGLRTWTVLATVLGWASFLLISGVWILVS
ncbi:SLC13 family permease [Arthrobacter castelli]|uniref:GntT/GntP/DsdX family permease n=1 Tax=Arthrobacter castelli TaxID=271431 RepID=UPI00040C43A6|nr:SLC13 family permease [Arthrobacter castelli]